MSGCGPDEKTDSSTVCLSQSLPFGRQPGDDDDVPEPESVAVREHGDITAATTADGEEDSRTSATTGATAVAPRGVELVYRVGRLPYV